MANHKSAKKRSRQDIKKNRNNSIVASNYKNLIKKIPLSIEKKENIDKTSTLLNDLNSKLSKAVQKGVLKSKTASRKLSSISKKISNIS